MARLSYEERLDIKKRSHKPLMWIGILSIVMLFAGLSSGYIVMRPQGTWVKITLPSEFFVSSLLLIISSLTFFVAVRLVKKGAVTKSTPLVLITLFLGLGFSLYQFKGWEALTSKGMYLADAVKLKGLLNDPNAVYGEDYKVFQNGVELKYIDGKFFDVRDVANTLEVSVVLESSNIASSFLYVLTGVHLVHLVFGLLSLIFVTFKCLRKKYSTEDHVGIEVSSIYWHFLDFLWLYLLGLLYFVG